MNKKELTLLCISISISITINGIASIVSCIISNRIINNKLLEIQESVSNTAEIVEEIDADLDSIEQTLNIVQKNLKATDTRITNMERKIQYE